MKFTRLLLPCAIGAMLLFSMCDYVIGPHDVVPVAPPTPVFDTTKRIALVEEWTGHCCPNCPQGAQAIENMKSFYGQKFIAISIHDGYFATPCNGIPGNYPLPACANGNTSLFQENFMCAVGASYTAAHPDVSSYPSGMVNRLVFQGSEILNHPSWDDVADSLVQEDACTSIHIDHTYNNSTREINATVSGWWMQSYSGTVNVALMLTESGMTGWQINGQNCEQQYVFYDVLRECINTPGSVTGEQAFTGTNTIETSWSYSMPSAYALPAAFNAANCKLVAIFYDTTTGEVLNAWEEPLQ